MYIEQTTSIIITGDSTNVPIGKYDEITIDMSFSYETVINNLQQLECDKLNIKSLPCTWINKLLDKITVNTHLIISPKTNGDGGLCTNCIFIDISKHKSIESVQSLTIHQIFPWMFDHFKVFIHIPKNIKNINITQLGFDLTKKTYEIFIVGYNQMSTIKNNTKGLDNKHINTCNMICFNSDNAEHTKMTPKDINNKIKEFEEHKNQDGKQIIMHNKDSWDISDVKAIISNLTIDKDTKIEDIQWQDTEYTNIIIDKSFRLDNIKKLPDLQCENLTIEDMNIQDIPNFLNKIKASEFLTMTILTSRNRSLRSNIFLLDLSKYKITNVTIQQYFDPLMPKPKLLLNISSDLESISFTNLGEYDDRHKYEVFITGHKTDIEITNSINNFDSSNIHLCTPGEITNKIHEFEEFIKKNPAASMHNKEYWTLDTKPNPINPHKPTEESKTPTNPDKQPNKPNETPLNPDKQIDNKQPDNNPRELSKMEIFGIIALIAAIISIIIVVVNKDDNTVPLETTI